MATDPTSSGDIFPPLPGLLAAFCRWLTVKILSLHPSAAAKCHMPQSAKSGYSQC